VHVLHYLAFVTIGAVFVVAGGAKVARGAEWPMQAAQMGVPRWLAVIVPWWEIVVGALAISGLGAPMPALAAAATLVVFTVLIVRLLRRGQHPPCSCFGAWSSAPLGWRHVGRNIGFLTIALIAAA
jgi:hypothetical protein